MEIPLNDPELKATDARVINYKGNDYLTTLSHLRLLCSDDGIHFHEPEGYPADYMGKVLFNLLAWKIAGLVFLRINIISRSRLFLKTA